MFTALALVLAVGGIPAASASAAPGDLDTSFNGNGTTTANVGLGPRLNPHSEAVAVAVDGSGRTVVAGWSGDNGGDFAVARFTAAGDLDPSFGGGDGRATADVGGGAYASALAIDGSGRIVVAGTAFGGLNPDFAVARFTAAGEVDPSFSGDGVAITDLGGPVGGANNDSVFAVTVDSSSRVVAVGSSDANFDPNDPSTNGTDFAVVRYTSAGALDAAFGGGDGIATADAGYSDQANGVAIAAGGQIVVAGNAYTNSPTGHLDFAVLRFSSAGVLDTAGFGGGDGIVTTDIGADSEDGANALAIDTNGKIVVAGGTYDSVQLFALARYTSAGVLDTAGFGGGDGIVTTAVGGGDDAKAVAIDASDRIVLASPDGLARYTPAGALDTAFGSGGTVAAQPGAVPDTAFGSGVGIDGSGRILVAGSVRVYEGGADVVKFGLARYRADGSLDSSFADTQPGVEQTSTVTFTPTTGTTYRIAVDGKNKGSGAATGLFDLFLDQPAGPPPNDNFADAIVVSGSSATRSGDTTHEATVETGEQPSYTGSVWYSWQAPSSDPVTINVDGAPAVGVFTGDQVDSLSVVASPDGSTVTFTPQAGTTYKIAVYGQFTGYGNDFFNGPFDLSLQPASAASVPAPNDNFAAAITLKGTNATAVRSPDSNVGATKETGEPQHLPGNAGGASVWYRWQAPVSGSVTIDTIGSDFDTVLAAYTGSAVGSLTQLASDDDSGGSQTSQITYPVTAGTTYKIAVDGYKEVGADPGSGYIQLHLSTHPSNDNFANAITLNGAAATRPSDSNVTAAKQVGEPNHAGNAGGASVWYSWQAPSSEPVTIETRHGDFDTLLGVYTGGSVGSLTEVASADNRGGVVTTGFPGPSYDEADAVAVDSAGRTVIAGYTDAVAGDPASADSDLLLMRYTAAGALDSSFGGGDGIVSTDVGADTEDRARAVAIDGNGRILVAENGAGEAVALVRYSSGGALDTSFGGGDGIVTSDFVVGATARALVLDGSGRIVLALETGVARYLSSGVVDTNFGGGDGFVTSDVGATGVAIDGNGRIVVSGGQHVGLGGGDYERYLAAARFTGAGAVDTSFGGGDGMVSSPVSDRDARSTGVAIDASGGIVVGGTSHHFTFGGEPTDGGNFTLTRYSSEGVLDTSFGGNGNGVAFTNVSDSDVAHAMAIDAAGMILLAGESVYTLGDETHNTQGTFVLARYTAAGAPDTTFIGGPDGRATTDVGAGALDIANAMAVGPSGKIVLAGATLNDVKNLFQDVAVARYQGTPVSGRTLTVQTSGTGSGGVAGTGISCGGDCSETYADGTQVTLAANAAPGSTFSGWSGACSGTGACQVTMDADKSVSAGFAQSTPPVQRTLTVNVTGGFGTVSSTPAGINCVSCSHSFDDGSQVVLTAHPETGYMFDHWTGCDLASAGQCTETMDANKSVTAVLAADPSHQGTLQVNRSGTGIGNVTGANGVISCPVACQFTFNFGTVVTLTASPATGSTFTGWSGGGCTGTGSCQMTIGGDVTVTASFASAGTNRLTITKTGSGSGIVSSFPRISCGSSCAENYDAGSQVVLTPTAAAGSYFAGWTGCDSPSGSSCTMTMDAPKTLTATFTSVPVGQHALTVGKGSTGPNAGSGTVTSSPPGIDCGNSCSASFDDAQAVTLSAAPAAGSAFSGWAGACSGSGNCQLTMDADQGVTALFDAVGPAQRTLTVGKAGTGIGTVTSSPAGISCGATCTHDFAVNTLVTLTAVAAASSSFTGWSGGCTGAGACQVTMDAAKTVNATFTADGTPALADTRIIKAKINPKRHKARFSFEAIGQPTGFQCALAKNHKKPKFKICKSPKTYKKLKPGKYTFQVRALSLAGMDLSPAKKRFKIKRVAHR